MDAESPQASHRRRMRPQLRLAIGFIHENSDRSIGVGDIAAAAGVSVRALQYMFRQRLGTTPVQYLRRVRLDRAHHDLSTADPATTTVQDIARRWGFAHPGRFSLAYKQAFGTPPSETLRN